MNAIDVYQIKKIAEDIKRSWSQTNTSTVFRFKSTPDFERILAEIKDSVYFDDWTENEIEVCTPEGHLSKTEFFKDKIAIFQNKKSVRALDVEAIENLYRKGHSLVVKNLHNRINSLRKMRTALQAVFDCHVDFQFFFTPANSSAFPIHCDDHDVLSFTFQGVKSWSIFDRRATPESKIEFRVSRGEAIYIPRGHFHQTLTLDEPSVHLSIGIYGHSYGSQLRDVMEKVILRHSKFQESLLDNHYPEHFFSSLTEEIEQEWNQLNRSHLKQAVTSINMLSVFDYNATYSLVEGLSLRVETPSTIIIEAEHTTKKYTLEPKLIEELSQLSSKNSINPSQFSRGATAFLIDFYRHGIVTKSGATLA